MNFKKILIVIISLLAYGVSWAGGIQDQHKRYLARVNASGGGVTPIAQLDCYQDNGEALDIGGVNVTAANIAHGTGHDSVANASVVIDANGDNYYFPCNETNGLLDPALGSLQVWYKHVGNVNYNHIFAQSTANGSFRAYRYIGTDAIYFAINGTNGTFSVASTMFDGSWHQLTFTWNQSASTRKLWVDSTEYTSSAAWTDTDIPSNNLYIGTRGDGLYASNGEFQDLKIYNYVITP